MEERITAVVADTSKLYIQALEKEMRKADVQVLDSTDDGGALVDIVKKQRPDAIVMDIILRELDGLEVLEEWAESLDYKPTIIIYTSMDTQAVIERASELGATYVVSKPIVPNEVVRRIIMFTGSTPAAPQEYRLNIDPAKRANDISLMLKRLGVPVHLQGYKYLAAAVGMICDDMGMVDEITNEVYAKIAQDFSTTPERVERSIRYAVETAFDRGNMDELDRIFGFTIDSMKGKPTNSEFIAMVADNIISWEH